MLRHAGMKPETARSHGVQLPSDTTASGLLHRLLVDARERFDDLKTVTVPEDAKVFRKTFNEVLPRFEAARANSEKRTEIARSVVKQAASALVYRAEDGTDVPITQKLAGPFDALATERLTGTGDGKLSAHVPWRSRTFEGRDVSKLADELFELRLLSGPAAKALSWTATTMGDDIDLAGHKFVMLGAGAELAPTPHLLAAGADVLWIDLVDPAIDPATFRGTLEFVKNGADLLTRPGGIVKTIEAFAGGEPVHVGMFAYAAGRGREWRLEAGMNAITRALTRGLVRSVTVYISPTSAVAAHPDDASYAAGRTAPAWQIPLEKIGLLARSHVREGSASVARSLVKLQGVSYQAAQYVAKVLVAEAFACAPDESRRVPRVSANVAGITNTSSMSEPVFQAGFAGAWHFAVDIYDPPTTRWVSHLLMLHDLLHPDAKPDPEQPAALFERQFHGGVYTMPYRLEDAIRIAGLIGVAKRPGLIPQFLRRR
jgi:hypothetical protein